MRRFGLPTYLTEPELGAGRAGATLRGVFAGMFVVQTLLAAVLAAVARALVGAGGSAPGPAGVLGWTLVALAVLELPLGLGLALAAGRRSGRGGPLAGALLAGVVLSTPAWFTALALATGQALAPLAVLLFLLASAYALGFAACGRLARRAAQSAPLRRPG